MVPPSHPPAQCASFISPDHGSIALSSSVLLVFKYLKCVTPVSYVQALKLPLLKVGRIKRSSEELMFFVWLWSVQWTLCFPRLVTFLNNKKVPTPLWGLLTKLCHFFSCWVFCFYSFVTFFLMFLRNVFPKKNPLSNHREQTANSVPLSG